MLITANHSKQALRTCQTHMADGPRDYAPGAVDDSVPPSYVDPALVASSTAEWLEGSAEWNPRSTASRPASFYDAAVFDAARAVATPATAGERDDGARRVLRSWLTMVSVWGIARQGSRDGRVSRLRDVRLMTCLTAQGDSPMRGLLAGAPAGMASIVLDSATQSAVFLTAAPHTLVYKQGTGRR